MWWLAFGGLGVAGSALCSGLACRLGVGHLVPDVALVVAVYISLHRSLTSTALAACVLTCLCTRQTLAADGLLQAASLVVVVGTYLSASSLSGGGSLLFAATCGLAVIVLHALVYVLLLWQQGHAGFASWASATLVLSGLCTSLVALLLHPLLQRLDRRLRQNKHEGLMWR